MSRLFRHLGVVLASLAVFSVPIAAQQDDSDCPLDRATQGLQTIASEAFPGASISYKQVRGMAHRTSSYLAMHHMTNHSISCLHTYPRSITRRYGHTTRL
jgi:hypothetical protein